MSDLTKRVAAVIADAFMEDYDEAPILYDEMAEAAIAEVRKADAEEKAAEQARQNMTYLQANIAQMDAFMARGAKADPIGYYQFAARKADFQRQLDEALAVSLPSLVYPEAE